MDWPAPVNLRTVRAYLLKEGFQQLWDYTSRKFYGFRAFRLRTRHSLGKLPEPESTHDFF